MNRDYIPVSYTHLDVYKRQILQRITVQVNFNLNSIKIIILILLYSIFQILLKLLFLYFLFNFVQMCIRDRFTFVSTHWLYILESFNKFCSSKGCLKVMMFVSNIHRKPFANAQTNTTADYVDQRQRMPKRWPAYAKEKPEGASL